MGQGLAVGRPAGRKGRLADRPGRDREGANRGRGGDRVGPRQLRQSPPGIRSWKHPDPAPGLASPGRPCALVVERGGEDAASEVGCSPPPEACPPRRTKCTKWIPHRLSHLYTHLYAFAPTILASYHRRFHHGAVR